MGRPTRYSKKLAEEICDRLGEGMTLFEIADDEAMPSKRTVIRWSRERDDFGPPAESVRTGSAADVAIIKSQTAA